jgi:aminocarboxymuconate-semialdehyde decarboxylase
MRDTSVTTQVISTIPVLFNYWAKPKDGLQTAQFLNDHIASTVQKHPQKFIGLGTLPMQDVELAISEMERCRFELNMPGIEIGSNINGINLSDKRFLPFYKRAEQIGCALFVHPWEMMGEASMQEYWLPWLVGMPAETSRAICAMIFGGIFEDFPTLRIAFAHGGGSFPFTLGRIQHGFDVRPDLVAVDNPVPPSAYIGKFWVDSLVHDPDALRFLITKLKDDRICLGSDFPFPLGEKHPGQMIDEMVLGKELTEKIFYRNALQWLNITKPV